MREFFERRLQLQLFLILFAAVVVSALSALLIWDSIHSAERVVINDMESQLRGAVSELARQFVFRANADSSWESLPLPSRDVSLRGISQVVLRPYGGVEGGFFADGTIVGYAFPTHDNPDAKTDVPAAERAAIEDVIRRTRTNDQAQQLLRGRSELVLVSAAKIPGHDAVAWAMQRRSRQTATLNRRILLVGLVLAALLSVAGTLRLALGLRRGIAQIQRGLGTLEKDFGYTLGEEQGELGEIARSINRMAAVRRKLEEELRREDRLRAVGRTVAGFAHEIRNPLNGIRLSMQVLESRLRNRTVSADDVKLVIGEVDRMDALLSELLAFREKKDVEVFEQDVVPFVERCAELTQPQHPTAQIRVELGSEPHDLRARVDAQRLTQAALNLLLNAAEAAGDKGAVLVRVLRKGDFVRIEVRDSGPGLSDEQQQHIFEAFYTTKANGTGLGLAVSRRLVREMGGDLIHERSGRGATFVIELPAVLHG